MKKLHWTQTPEGSGILRRRAKAAWKRRKRRAEVLKLNVQAASAVDGETAKQPGKLALLGLIMDLYTKLSPAGKRYLHELLAELAD